MMAYYNQVGFIPGIQTYYVSRVLNYGPTIQYTMLEGQRGRKKELHNLVN